MDLRTESSLAPYFQLNEGLSQALEHWLTDLEKLSHDPLPAQLAILPIFPKSIKLHRSTMLLCAAGHGEDALVLLRVIQELALVARYITQEPHSDRAERWVQFSVVARYESLQTYLEDPDFADSRARVDPEDPTITEVVRLANEAQDRFQFWRTRRASDGRLLRVRPWAGTDPNTGRDITVARISEIVGWHSEYRTLYSLASLYVHAGLHGVEGHVHFGDENRVKLSAAPTTEHVELVLAESYPYLLSIAGEWCKVLGAPEHLWQAFYRLRAAYADLYGQRVGEQEASAKVGRLLDQQPFQADDV